MIEQNDNIIDFGEEATERAKCSHVSIQHIDKIYSKSEKAVWGFDLDIKPQEFIVIVGPSGCGKSTTLRMIAGFEEITSGNLFIDGEYANYKPSKDRKMAMVFQSYALYPQMTVYENIAFPLKINKYKQIKTDKRYLTLLKANELLGEEHRAKTKNVLISSDNTALTKMKKKPFVMTTLGISDEVYAQILNAEELLKTDNFGGINELISANSAEMAEIKSGYEKDGQTLNDNGEVYLNGEPVYIYAKLDKAEIEKRVFHAAEILNLGEYLDRLPKQLSGGQMQRVALGRAIVKDVPLFLMDEPLSNLDAKLRMSMRSEIVKLHNRLGATVIYVTHDQTEAMTMATKVVVMSKGFIQQIDTPDKCYNEPNNMFVANFLGAPSINFIDATYDNGKLVLGEKCSHALSRDLVSAHDEYYKNLLARIDDKLVALEEGRVEEVEEFLKRIKSSKLQHQYSHKADEKKKGIRKIIDFVKNFKFGKKKGEEEAVALINGLRAELDELKRQANEQAVSAHPLVVGIRPERIKVTKEQQKEDETNFVFKTKTGVCELLGADYYINLNFLDKDFVSKTDVNTHFNMGDDVYVSFDINDILIFDSITGERLAKVIRK